MANEEKVKEILSDDAKCQLVNELVALNQAISATMNRVAGMRERRKNINKLLEACLEEEKKAAKATKKVKGKKGSTTMSPAVEFGSNNPPDGTAVY